jgi:hypothetical protein
MQKASESFQRWQASHRQVLVIERSVFGPSREASTEDVAALTAARRAEAALLRAFLSEVDAAMTATFVANRTPKGPLDGLEA